jgi:phospholipase/carboxylesterase
MQLKTYQTYQRQGAADAPVVLAFHGTGGDELQFVGLIDEILPQAGIVAPRGDVSEFGASRFFRRTAEGVYDMADLRQRTAQMLDFVSDVRKTYPDRAIYALGYSNGANILASMLFENPDLFDRAALMHPLIPWTPQPQPRLKEKPVMISAGMQDPISPINGSLALIEWFKAQEASVESVIAAGGHQITAPELSALRDFLCAA